MIAGYNTNVSYKGETYHIQTEDSGLRNPIVVTLLYSKGAILASKKTNYSHLVDDTDYSEKVKRLMKEQHRSMIKDLLTGKCTGEYVKDKVLKGPDEQAGQKPAGKGQISQSLDDILLNYIIKRK